MSVRTVDVGTEFYPRLANRDRNQGDGKHTAVEFREKYLSELDSEEAWQVTEGVAIVLDFSSVKKIGPSFANEAFGHFAKYARPDVILRRIELRNATRIQRLIVEQEVEAAYSNV